MRRNLAVLYVFFFTIRTPHEKEALQRRIDATDAQIDKLVYELYGLTEKEIGIVEAGK